jgi:hypothetical protein
MDKHVLLFWGILVFWMDEKEVLSGMGAVWWDLKRRFWKVWKKAFGRSGKRLLEGFEISEGLP